MQEIISSRRWFSLRSSWWLPLPFVIIWTPEREEVMWGEEGVKSSSQVSEVRVMESRDFRGARPKGQLVWGWLRREV